MNARLLLALCLTLPTYASKPTQLDPLPNLRDKSYGQFPVTHDISADRVSYQTADHLRVPAIVYHSAGATVVQHPALVIVNSENADKSSPFDYWAGILYARAGAVVLTYDPIGQYERAANHESGNQLTVPANLAPQLSNLTITDILQAVEYLKTRKDVDPQNIAILAASNASLACARNPAIRACVIPEAENIPIANRNAPLIANAPLSRTVALWLNQRLKFPNWTKKQILAMPEKDLNGQPALGDIPPVPRADLHALPIPVWEAEKDSYTAESWLEQAKTADSNQLKNR